MKAKYRLKRKTFGLLGNIGGTALQATGSIADSGVGKIGGAALGAKIGSKIGLGIGGFIPEFNLAGAALGAVAGGALGAKAAGTAGKALKQTGSDLRS